MSTFLSNVLKLVSGSIIAQLIGIILIPIVTRLYLPEDFGVFQLFLSISSVIVVFSALSYEHAILLPKEDDDSATIVVLCLILILIISFLTSGIFMIFSEEIATILNTPQISPYFTYLPFVVLLNSVFSVGTYWLSRRKRFGIIAASQIVNSVMGKAVQAGAGFYSAASFGLIIGWIVGYGASLAVLFLQIKDDITLFRAVTIDRIKIIAVRYKKFPIFSSWSILANTISTQIATFLLVFFFTPTIVGYFSVANMVVFLPMGLIGSATSQVFFQKACEEKNQNGSIKNIVRDVQQRLISLGMFPTFALMIIGADLFSVVLGPQWSVAGEYAGILAPWLLFVFIASPLSAIFSVLEKQAVDLIFNILILISRFIVLIIGGLSGNPILALILYSITGVIFWGGMNLYLLKISGIPYLIGLHDYVKYFFISFIIAIPLLFVKFLSVAKPLILVVAVVVSLVYYAVIIQFDPVMKGELTAALRGLKYGRKNSSGK